MKEMFKDSAIAQEIKLNPKKIGYFISFGLAPYFKEKLKQRIQDSECFVACFDEATNNVIQKGQMDIWIRYWSKDSDLVETNYFSSSFLGHARAKDLLEWFKVGLKDLDIQKMIQIGMDGPNVNWKFLEEFKHEFKSEESTKQLLEIGSCGLHVIHGAFQYGNNATDWDLGGFLKALYWMFKGSPVRKSDFQSITSCTSFPKPFCGHRWLENVSVVERALMVLPHIRTYVKDVSPKPTIVSFKKVEEFLKDKFLVPKLEFFKSISNLLEPFLRKYQSPKPLAPFLYSDLFPLMQNLTERYIKPEVLQENKTASKLIKLMKRAGEPNFKGLKQPKDVNIGKGALRSMPKSQDGTLSSLSFHSGCLTVLKKMGMKIAERSPIKFPLVRYLSSLAPAYMIDQQTVSIERFEKASSVLLDANQVSTTEAERADEQYRALVQSPDFRIKLKQFDPKTHRLDSFYVEHLSSEERYAELWKCFKILLLLSNGNAAVEGGFSVNKDLLVDNLQERSLTALRMVYDTVRAAGGALEVSIDRDLVLKCRSAHSKYTDQIEKDKKEMGQNAIKKLENRKRVMDLLKEERAKKQRLTEEAEATEAKIKTLAEQVKRA